MAGAGSKGRVQAALPGGCVGRQGAFGSPAAGGKSPPFPRGEQLAELESRGSTYCLRSLCSLLLQVALC